MKPFTEEDRYIYPLDRNSVVLDCGGYEGRWTAGIHERYGCVIHVLEPVKKFHDQIVDRFRGNPAIHVHNFGISGDTCDCTFRIKGDMTGRFVHDNPEEVPVRLLSVDSVFSLLDIIELDLLKLNIEGSEFDVVEKLVRNGEIVRVKNLQVQWHDVAPNAAERYSALQHALAATHHLTFDAQWIWQNWRRNEQ